MHVENRGDPQMLFSNMKKHDSMKEPDRVSSKYYFHKRIFIYVALLTCLNMELSEPRDLFLEHLDRNTTHIQQKIKPSTAKNKTVRKEINHKTTYENNQSCHKRS